MDLGLLTFFFLLYKCFFVYLQARGAVDLGLLTFELIFFCINVFLFTCRHGAPWI